MKATPLSERPYYPYLLANGNDAVLINWSGAMISGITGHMSGFQNDGTVCAWHKMEHRRKGNRTNPIVISGYDAIVDNEVCEVRWYEQEFDPRRAVLRSRISFRRGVELDVTTFLTFSGILVCEFAVLKSEAASLSIQFRLLVPDGGGTATPNCEVPETSFAVVPGGIDGTYLFRKTGIAGTTSLRSDRSDGAPFYDISRPGIRFDNVPPGWRGTMYTACTDAPGKPAQITPALRREHEKEWETYFSTSRIELPDPELQYSYETARYMVRAAQHRGGAVVCGLLPHMWSGGTVCPCDAEYAFQAMLQCNNVTEARRFLQFYIAQYPEGERLVRSLGLKGAAFSNWSNVRGEHCGSRDPGYEIIHRKPVMVAIIGIAAGKYLLYTGAEDPDVKKLLHGCAEFMSGLARKDGTIPMCTAGNESYVDVERDSFMLAVTITVLEMDARFNALPGRAELAGKLRAELEKNRDPAGIILPWKGAGYYSAMPLWCQHYCPGIHDAGQLDAFRKAIRTPWGTDGEQPSEVYRHWLWDNPEFARNFAREGAPEKAFPLLKSWFDYAAATGAVPEKIRLDGHVSNYWYPSPSAIFLQAVTEAFGRMEKDTLYLLPGFDGEWQDLQAEDLRLEGGFLLSLRVKRGKLLDFTLSGGDTGKEIALCLNPAYGTLPARKIFPGTGTITVTNSK
ncbi:MAG: hypothetical protein IJT50_03355 [Lentisphaeria bacterium]|nr:hypothetical protein [Lentisphaeria bacterium]